MQALAEEFTDERMSQTTIDAAMTWVGINDIKRITGVHAVSIWRWVRAGSFPAPSYFGSQRRWCLAEIEAWVAERRGAPRARRAVCAAPEAASHA